MATRSTFYEAAASRTQGRLRSPTRSVSAGAIAALLLFAATLLLRSGRFGDPNIEPDETFYLQAAELMMQGAVPYVDFWDRKPVGLFLLYGAIRLLGGDGVMQYQLVAGAFAFGTALILMLIALRSCGWAGACAAGLVYIASLNAIGGSGGQSPVFYNLFMAAAALLTLKALETVQLARATRLGAGAMLLCGLAMQIKYTAAVEGCFFGLLLLWLVWSRTRSPRQVVQSGLLFILCALAPTAAVLAAYAAMGHLDAFWFANFISITKRPPTALGDIVARLVFISIILFPLFASAAAGLFLGLRQGSSELNAFRLGWPIAAVVGFVLIGTFYSHYALPLLAPLAVAAAPLFDRARIGAAAAGIAIGLPLAAGYGGPPPAVARAQIEQMNRTVEANLRGGCLYMFDGPPIVQHLTGACHLSKYIFPWHLNSAVERTGLGIDPAVELRRVLDARPTVIVSADIPMLPANLETSAILRQRLARDYRLVGTSVAHPRTYRIYALN